MKLNKKDLVSELNASADIIRLKAGRLIIESGNCKLDDKGNLTCTGGTIGGFVLSSTSLSKTLSGIYDYNSYDSTAVMCMVMDWLYKDTSLIKLYDMNGDGQITAADYAKIKSILLGDTDNTKTISGTMNINSNDPKNCISINNGSSMVVSIGVGGINTNSLTADNIVCGYTSNNVLQGIAINGHTSQITFIKSSGGATLAGTTITTDAITSQTINNTSLESIKKNITKFDNALEIIESSEIYEYNFKDEEDTEKKHIGFVIGENYKTPSQVIAKNETSIESYSMGSIMWRGMQEILKKLSVLEAK